MAILLGVDPGSHRLGWGVVEVVGSRIEHRGHGTCTAPARDDLGPRLAHLYDGLREVLRTHRPESAGIERVYAARNVRSALTLGHARGMVLLALAQDGIPVSEYAPSSVKSSVGAHGHGGKDQVAAMVARLLGVDLAEAGSDATDALAIALCHAHERKRRHLLRRVQDAG